MWDPNSPILDFYPQEFEQDLNGKKQDWEAVVKIPFIDEKKLLRAMQGEYYVNRNCCLFMFVSSSRATVDNGGKTSQHVRYKLSVQVQPGPANSLPLAATRILPSAAPLHVYHGALRLANIRWIAPR